MRTGSRLTASVQPTDPAPTEPRFRVASGALLRRRALAGMSLAAAVALSACSGSPAPSAAPSSAAAPSGDPSAAPERDGAADLVIWADNNRASVLQKFADEFGQENGVKVSVQVSTDVRRDFSAAFQSGSGPDVIVGAHDWLGGLVQNDAVSPLNLGTDAVAKFDKSAITAATYNGQLYGVPYAIENLAVIRNTKLAPNPAKTLEDLVATGKAAVKDGKADNALLLQVGKTGDAYGMYPFLSAFGGGFFGKKANGDYDPSKVLVNSAGSLKGAEVLADLGKQKVLSTNVDGSNVESLFTAGKAPYMISGPWAIANTKKAGIDYAIDPLPTIDGGSAMRPLLGVQMFYVSAKAKNKALAEEFVTTRMASVEVQEALFAAGNRTPALTEALTKVAADNPDVKAWAAAAKNGDPLPNIPAMNAVWAPVGQAQADIISGKSSPKAAMDAAQKQVEEGAAKG